MLEVQNHIVWGIVFVFCSDSSINSPSFQLASIQKSEKISHDLLDPTLCRLYIYLFSVLTEAPAEIVLFSLR